MSFAFDAESLLPIVRFTLGLELKNRERLACVRRNEESCKVTFSVLFEELIQVDTIVKACGGGLDR